MHEPSNYQFRYLSLTVTASIRENVLHLKQGIRRFQVPLSAMKGFFVQPQAGDARELVLAYESAPGKRKIVRTYADVGQGNFDRLLDDLAAARPETDLRALSPKEAHARLGAVNTQRAALIAVPLIVVSVMIVFTLPFLIHGLDSGSSSITVEALAAGTVPDSRNLQLVGALDAERGIVETVTHKGRTTTHNYFPMFPVGAAPDTPVSVVLETSDVSDAELAKLAAAGVYPCTLRNVFWEGLSSDNVAFFETKYGMTVSEDVKLCELGEEGAFGLVIFFLAIGTTLVTMIIVAVVLARQKRRG